MEKVTGAELIEQVAKQLNMSQAAVKRVLAQTSEQIIDCAKKGVQVSLPGIGKFYPVDRAARAGRNPKTGEAVQIPAKRVLAFKATAGGVLGE